MSRATMDAAMNTFRRAHRKHPPEGLTYPYDAKADTLDTTGAVLQSDWADPRTSSLTWREKSKWSFYNNSNVPIYMTCNRKKLKHNLTLATGSAIYELLETFPTHYNSTPLAANATSLEWAMTGFDQTSTAVTTGGSSAALYIPRAYGAFTERFPYEPRPSFLQAKASNLFNLSSNLGEIDASLGVTNLVMKNSETTSTANDMHVWAHDYNGGAGGPVSYVPNLPHHYFTRTYNNAQASGGTVATDSFNAAYKSMYFNNPSANDTTNTFQAANQASYADVSTTGSLPTTTYTTVDWSTAKEYNEMLNRKMRQCFRMTQRRFTVHPGKVLRLTFTSRKNRMSGTRMLRTWQWDSPWKNSNDSTHGGNESRTLTNWGFSTYLPEHGGLKSGFNEEWISIAMRGPHMPDITTANALNSGPAELTVKIDHTVFTNFRAGNGVTVKKHRTVVNKLAHSITATNMAFTYPQQVVATIAKSNTTGASYIPPFSAP